MKITLTSDAQPLNYIAKNEAGQTIKLSGEKDAVSPMEAVLMAAAGCSAVDVELILSKMRQQLTKLEVKVEGRRAENQIPKVFTDIHLHYKLYGDIKPHKAEDAVDKSVKKYCSVITMLEATVHVTFSWEIIEDQMTKSTRDDISKDHQTI